MENRVCGTYLSNSWHVGLLESLKRKPAFKKGWSPVKACIESCKD